MAGKDKRKKEKKKPKKSKEKKVNHPQPSTSPVKDAVSEINN